MADVRLIDANALAQRFSAMQECANMRDHVYLMGVLSVIDNAPTISAAPVVRCRECEHFVKYDDDYRDEYRCDGYCKKIAYIMDGYYRGAENRNADDFCSHGAKMDGGSDNV